MTTCKAVIEVDFGKYFEKGKKRKLRCCLFEEEHEGLKHYNPCLLLTKGGHTVQDVEDVNDWSCYLENMKD